MKQIDGICIQFKKALKSIQIYGTNENGEDMRILQSILCAGLYPNVVRVKLPSTKYKSNIKGNVEKGIDSKEIKFYEKVLAVEYSFIPHHVYILRIDMVV